MKKLLATISIVVALVMVCAPMAFASGLEITGISPKPNQKGLQVTNMAVKVTFNEDVSDTANDATNQTKLIIKSAPDKDGNVSEYSYAKGNVQLVHSDKYPNELWYVLDATFVEDTEYSIEILEGVVSSNGNKLGADFKSSFKTRNMKTDSLISVVMMIGMVVIMVLATSKATKNSQQGQEQQQLAAKKQVENLNPYKIAKEKNISLEEAKAYVEKEKAKYAKEKEKADAEAKKKELERQAEIEAMEAKIEAEMIAKRKEYLYHVKGPKSITLSGRQVPKAVIKEKKKNEEAKLANERARQAEREANSKGKKSKK
ncbi:MAG: Ig-like domain-containing protein [Bacillota bacterium]|nr:Ig-like domain-containing protein [Bacillota bacterium]